MADEQQPEVTLSPEELAQLQALQEQAFLQAIGETASLVRALHPKVPELLAVKSAERAVLEQQFLNEKILPDMLDGSEMRLSHPRIGVNLTTKLGATGQLFGSKDPGTATTLGEVVAAAEVVALLTSPLARALLYASGVNVEWAQAKAPSSLIIPR